MTTMQHARWELAARLALADRGIGRRAADPLINDVTSHCAQRGRDPWESFGSPEEFAASVAAALADQPGEGAAMARVDTRGATAAGYVGGAAFAVVALSVPALIALAIAHGGARLPVTPAGLAGTLLLALTGATLLAAPGALRASGHHRWVPAAFAGGGLLVLATAVAFTALPDTPAVTVPVPAVVTAELLLIWLLTRTGTGTGTGRTSGRPTGGAIGRVLGRVIGRAPGGADPEDAPAWLDRLERLLVGRHDVPAERAAALAGEARAHLAAAGTSPGEEFGSLDRYTADLAASESRRAPWWRGRTAGRLLQVAAVVSLGWYAVTLWPR